MSRASPALRTLAARAGILAGYRDYRGRPRRTGDATRVALLGAMGWEAGTERAARASLAAWDEAARAQLLPPVTVAVARGTAPTAAVVLQPRLPRAAGWRPPYHVEIHTEDGAILVREGRLRRGRPVIGLPPLPLGYHTARVDVAGKAVTHPLIVAPGRCPAVRGRLGGRRVFGISAQLYTTRSARDWGVGDCSDLAQLAEWAADDGAAFLAVNPLHLLRNRGADISPYRPVSRLARNPLYLDPTAVPEFAACPEAHELVESPAARERVARLRAAGRVDYAGVMALKEPVLRALYRRFIAMQGRDGVRANAWHRWNANQGTVGDALATFLALEAALGADPRRWPAELRRADAAGVEQFRRQHADEVDYHRWVQFEFDRQLAAAAARAPRPLGLIGDLAVGAAPGGADDWAFPDLHAPGVHLGAPPDDYAAQGQDWALATLDPHRLAADGFRFWALLLRRALAHVGGLRLDHVLGLVRQYWIPPGGTAADGAYVRSPTAALLAVLALEATRRPAIVIGEDLGTVPPGLGSVLRRSGILSTRVLYFERDRRGAFRPAARYPRHAVVAVGTHDHPPLAGWWLARDLDARNRAGALSGRGVLARARARRARDRGALWRRLGSRTPPGDAGAPAGLCAAAHSFLAGTPAALLAVSLDDLVGETEPVNLPGVGAERFSSWTRRLARPLESLHDDPVVRRARGDLGPRVRRGTGG